MHDRNSFLTLTYSDETLPRHGQLIKRDLQLFFKRLRKITGPFRYVACGEYGELRRRPHFHVALFGVDFSIDRVEYGMGVRGDKVYVSPSLALAWGKSTFPLGHTIGSLTFESAAYIARYITKRVTGVGASPLPLACDPDTGELIMPNPEFLVMSKGIGHEWFKAFFMSDVFPHGRVITAQGTPAPVPRYYKDKLRAGFGMQALMEMRHITSLNAEKALPKRVEEDKPQRRAARTIYAKARMGIFKRDVKEQ